MITANVTTVGELMSSPVLCAHLNQRITQLGRLFFELNIHHLPVVDTQGQLIGMLSASDLLKTLITKVPQLERADEETINKTLTVGEIMTPDPVSVHQSTAVREAAAMFSSQNFQSLPVVEDGKLVGIITTRDLIKYLGAME